MLTCVSDEWKCPQRAALTDEALQIATIGDNWRCDNMACIHRTQICNDVYDCKDKSDERRCRKTFLFFSFFFFLLFLVLLFVLVLLILLQFYYFFRVVRRRDSLRGARNYVKIMQGWHENITKYRSQSYVYINTSVVVCGCDSGCERL